MNNMELTAKIKELRELQALIDEAQEEAEAIRDELKAHMGEREELRVGEYRITYKAVTSSRIDTALLKRTFTEDFIKDYSKTVTTRRFCVA